MSSTTIFIIMIIFIIFIFIIGIIASSALQPDDDPDDPEDDPVDPDDDPVDPDEDACIYPTIDKASGTYVASTNTSSITVKGTNFLVDSNWEFGKYSGIITYVSSTECTISIDVAVTDRNCLTISNSSCNSNAYCFKLDEEHIESDEIKKLELVSGSPVQGSTDNYNYYVFNKYVANAKINVISTIDSTCDFGIICVGAGGGGSSSWDGLSNGGGGGGASIVLTGIPASVGNYFTINVGYCGNAGNSGGGREGDPSTVKMVASTTTQINANGGEGGTPESKGIGAVVQSSDVTILASTKNTANGGNGGDESDGNDAVYINQNDTETTNRFTVIPSELIGIDGIAVCYGGGGGGAKGSANEEYTGGEGGKGGGASYSTGGKRGVKGTASSGKNATHYGGGGGAGGYKSKEPWQGGEGAFGCVVFYIKKVYS